jgi:hypothetical protein
MEYKINVKKKKITQASLSNKTNNFILHNSLVLTQKKALKKKKKKFAAHAKIPYYAAAQTLSLSLSLFLHFLPILWLTKQTNFSLFSCAAAAQTKKKGSLHVSLNKRQKGQIYVRK